MVVTGRSICDINFLYYLLIFPFHFSPPCPPASVSQACVHTCVCTYTHTHTRQLIISWTHMHTQIFKGNIKVIFYVTKLMEEFRCKWEGNSSRRAEELGLTCQLCYLTSCMTLKRSFIIPESWFPRLQIGAICLQLTGLRRIWNSGYQ